MRSLLPIGASSFARSAFFTFAALTLAPLAACSGAPAQPAGDAGATSDAVGAPDLPSPEELAAWLQPLVDQRYVHGMAVGLVDRTGTVVQGYGRVGDTGAPPDGDTIFQVGSVTKTFVSTWLATRVVAGQLHTGDPVQPLLPAGVTVPTFQGTPITLEDLATHTSGLPDAPTNLAPADGLNPWADYTTQDLYAFLAGYSLPYAPGTQWAYSNTGEDVLGIALGLHDGVTFEQGLHAIVAAPLGLADTTTALTPEQEQRLSPGYDGDLQPIEPWTFTDATAPCGALRSTVHDLLRYASAQMGLVPSPLSDAMKLTQRPIHPTSLPGWSIGLNWIVSTDGRTVWHNGGVYGAGAFVGFDPTAQKAAVVLVDTGEQATVTTVGFDPVTSVGLLLVQWLQGTPPPALASILPQTIALAPAQLQPLAGTYALDGGAGSLAIALQGGALVLTQADVWPRPMVLYPTSSTSFTCREAPLSLDFAVAGDGGATGVTASFAGQTFHGTKQ
jgi:D-alanyl-D-alanine-carboxypeptidase/D-alanyl-D-alanine-endopeptidase